MNTLQKCQETMITQVETYQFIEIIITLLVQIFRDKQIQAFPQQTNFIEKLEEDNRATMSFKAKNYFNYCNRIIKTMKHQDILNLMHEASDSKFLIRKWDIFKL